MELGNSALGRFIEMPQKHVYVLMRSIKTSEHSGVSTRQFGSDNDRRTQGSQSDDGRPIRVHSTWFPNLPDNYGTKSLQKRTTM